MNLSNTRNCLEFTACLNQIETLWVKIACFYHETCIKLFFNIYTLHLLFVFHAFRVQRSLILQPALRASCRQDVLAQPRSQRLSSSRPQELALGGGKMRDAGNEVGTSPEVISTSLKKSMFYRAPFHEFQRKISPKTFTCPLGKWRINSTSLTTKSTSPRLSDLNFFVPCALLSSGPNKNVSESQ